MKYSDGRGLKTQQWYANEIMQDDDVNGVGIVQYENWVDLITNISDQTTYSEIIKGLDLDFSTLFTCTLRSGTVINYSGTYMDDRTFGFVSQAGSAFAVAVGEDALVAFDNAIGQTGDRRDLLEIRPVETDYNNLSRKFKDPVTGLIISAPVNTSKEYDFEFAVRKGTAVAFPVKSLQFPTESGASNVYDGKYLDIELELTSGGDVYRRTVRLFFSTDGAHTPSDDLLQEVEDKNYLYALIAVTSSDSGTTIATAVETALNSFSSGDLAFTYSRVTDTITFTAKRSGNLQFTGDSTGLISAVTTVTAGGYATPPTGTSGWIKIAEVVVREGASDLDAVGGEKQILPIDDVDKWSDYSSGTGPTQKWNVVKRLEALESTTPIIKTYTDWKNENPTPGKGVWCIEAGTNRYKYGDGITAYNSLPYGGGDLKVNGDLDVESSIATKDGIFIGNPAHRRLEDELGLELGGSTSSALMSVQDGNGRIQLKWNATRGTSETYIVAGENAFFEDYTISGASTSKILEWKWASGSGKVAGDPITWLTLMSLTGDGDLELLGSFLPRVAIDYVSSTIANNSTLVVPKGVYIIENLTASFYIQVRRGGTWRTAITNGAVVFSDGSNVRFRNVTGVGVNATGIKF